MTSTAESTSVSEPPDQPKAPPDQQFPETSESPAEEIGRRLADQAPLWPVAHAAGLQNMRDVWEDARIKRKMDRLVQARALGVESVLENGGNEEMPGAISIKGDEKSWHQHYHNHPAAPPAAATNAAAISTPTGTPTTSTASTPPSRRRRLSSLLMPVIVGGGLLGAGVGGTMLYHYLTDRPASVTTITQPGGQFEYRYGIEQRQTPTEFGSN